MRVITPPGGLAARLAGGMEQERLDGNRGSGECGAGSNHISQTVRES